MDYVVAGVIKDGGQYAQILVNSQTGAVLAEMETGVVQASGLYIDNPVNDDYTLDDFVEKLEEDAVNKDAVGIIFRETGYIELTEDTAYEYDWTGNFIGEKVCSFDLDPDDENIDPDDME